MTAQVPSTAVALDSILKRFERHSLSSREYIESRFIIKDKKKRYVLLKLNRVQEKIWETIEELQALNRPVKIDVLKPRQHGVSTVCLGIGFDKVIRTPGMHAVSIAHEDDVTHHFRMIIRRFYKNLPDDEKPRMQYDRKGYFYFPEMDSAYHIWTAGSRGVGRGFTVNYIHASEMAQWPSEPEQIWAGIDDAATPDAWRIRESTPQGMGWWYSIWLDDKKAGATYTPLFFPWWWADEYRLAVPATEDNISVEEREFLGKADADLYQLAWRRMKMRERGPLFWQEFAEDDVSCFLGLEACAFDVAKCREGLERVQRVEPLLTLYDGALKIWKKPELGRRYVAGCDPATGEPGGDPQGLGILDWETCEAVADLHGHWPLNVFTAKVNALCSWYNDALLAIEREPYGHYMLGMLTGQASDMSYPNLYWHRDYDGKREKLGWVTSRKTRPTMIEGLAIAIREGGIWVPDEMFWRECLSFVRTDRKKDGEAAQGQHDDRVIKYAIALEIRKEISAGPIEVQTIRDLSPSPL